MGWQVFENLGHISPLSRFVVCGLLFSLAIGILSCQTIEKNYSLRAIFSKTLKHAWEKEQMQLTMLLIEQHGYTLSLEKRDHRPAFWQLRHSSDARKGLYWLRNDQWGRSIHLQAPHRYSDIYTGEITELLCLEQAVQSCSFNLTHRREFDFAHEPGSAFQEFVAAILDHDQDALIAQLHGFARENRSGNREQYADIILSGGDLEAGSKLQSLAQQSDLDRRFKVLVFGASTEELGATVNVQNQLIRSRGSGRFLHVELSYQFRRQLLNDPGIRRQLYELILLISQEWKHQNSQ